MLNLLTMTLAASTNEINLQNIGTGFSSLASLTIPDVISGLIKMTLVIAAVVFFFILVIGGIKWIASGGDKAQTEAARNQITAALVGLVIVFAAWAIIALISAFFNVTIFNLTIPVAGS